MLPAMISAIFIFAGFAITAEQTFGTGVFEYRSMAASLSSLTRATLSDFDQEPLILWSPVVGQIVS